MGYALQLEATVLRRASANGITASSALNAPK